MDRIEYGPEFDDRLIKLVKENAAIYDVSHPNYRRTPVRIAIWDSIAKELGAPSRFLQTKWKNIRYNYMQEQKSLETGIVNTNIRKRRFTEDLSFLKHTALRRVGNNVQTKGQFNGSDDSNSYMYPDNLAPATTNTYEVIELDQSEDETDDFLPDVSAFLAPTSPQDPYAQPDNPDEDNKLNSERTEMKLEPEQIIPQSVNNLKRVISPTNSQGSNRSSPLLTPISTVLAPSKNVLSNGNHQLLQYNEVTIQRFTPTSETPQVKREIASSSPLIQVNSVTSKNPAATPNRSTFNNDPIELYCLSLVDSLRAMPRSERERVKFEFAKILKDAHYKDE